MSRQMSGLNPLTPRDIIEHHGRMSAEIEAVLSVARQLGIPPKAAYPARTAALILGVGKESVYRAVHSGAVAAIRVGKILYIPLTELARVLAEGGLEAKPRAGTRG